MTVILFLHIMYEAIIGILFLVLPNATEMVPGFAAGEGDSYRMLLKMYGLAALFLSAIGLYAWEQRKKRSTVSFHIVAFLSGYHLLMAGVQLTYNPDARAMLLEFLLAIFLAGIYVRRKEITEQY